MKLKSFQKILFLLLLILIVIAYCNYSTSNTKNVYIYQMNQKEVLNNIGFNTKCIQIYDVDEQQYLDNISKAKHVQTLILSNAGKPLSFLNNEYAVCNCLTVEKCGLQQVNFLHQFLNIVTLNLSQNEIENIEPIFQLLLIESLNLDNNRIQSFVGIKSLSLMKQLSISGNRIEDISELCQLSKLQVLNLSNNLIGTNQIPNLYLLLNLHNLKLIGNPLCNNIQQDDLIPICTKNIDILDKSAQYFIIESQNSVISPKQNDVCIRQCEKLKTLNSRPEIKQLCIAYCANLNLNCIKNCTQLISLTLIGCRIKNGKYLNLSQSIQFLYLVNNDLCNLSGLEHLTNLKVLDLSRNRISDLSGIEKFQQLVQINLQGNIVQNCKQVYRNRKLQKIDFSFNNIAEQIDLRVHTDLVHLIISHQNSQPTSCLAFFGNKEPFSIEFNYDNAIAINDTNKQQNKMSVVTTVIQNRLQTEISYSFQMSSIPKLKEAQSQVHYVSSEYQGLRNVKLFEELTQIRKLNIRSNSIRSLSPLSKMTEIQLIWADRNKIVSIKPLSNCNRLKQLFLSYNNLQNQNEVVLLSHFQDLEEVDLHGNPSFPSEELIAGVVSEYSKQCLGLSMKNVELCELQQLRMKLNGGCLCSKEVKQSICQLTELVEQKAKKRKMLLSDLENIYLKVKVSLE